MRTRNETIKKNGHANLRNDQLPAVVGPLQGQQGELSQNVEESDEKFLSLSEGMSQSYIAGLQNILGATGKKKDYRVIVKRKVTITD